MAKTDSARNMKMSFFIRLSPFERSEAFQLEPRAKTAGRRRFAGLVPILERFRGVMSGKTVLGRSMRAIGRMGDREERRGEGKIGGARRNRTADNGFADHVNNSNRYCLCEYSCLLYPFYTQLVVHLGIGGSHAKRTYSTERAM